MAYTLSLAHSVIPHHHHQTVAEAIAHEHADGHHHHASDSPHHHHDQDESDSRQTSEDSGHFFFFSHELNADVLIKHGSVDNPVKNKNAQVSAALKKEISSFDAAEHLAFHPPQDDPFFVPAILSSRSLRAPPCLFI
jgi:hypothetical protein